MSPFGFKREKTIPKSEWDDALSIIEGKREKAIQKLLERTVHRILENDSDFLALLERNSELRESDFFEPDDRKLMYWIWQLEKAVEKIQAAQDKEPILDDPFAVEV